MNISQLTGIHLLCTLSTIADLFSSRSCTSFIAPWLHGRRIVSCDRSRFRWSTSQRSRRYSFFVTMLLAVRY